MLPTVTAMLLLTWRSCNPFAFHILSGLGSLGCYAFVRNPYIKVLSPCGIQYEKKLYTGIGCIISWILEGIEWVNQ